MNTLSSRLSRFLAVFLMIQTIATPLKADWFWYRPAPVAVYREPAPIVVYHETPASDAAVFGACAVGVGVGALLGGIFGGKSENRKFKEYTEMFKNLGYSRAEAQVYAQLAVENPGGYAAVVENIEREKELKYKRETEQKLMQQKIRGEQELMKLKHDQKVQQFQQEQLSKNDFYQKFVLILMTIFLSLGSIFMGVLLIQRLNRKN